MSICTLRSSELNTVQTYTFNRFHRGSKNHPVHQLNQNNIRLNSKIFTSLDFIIGLNLANKRGNYNASAKEMHKRSFWLSHKLNYGNMLLFVLVWRENQTAHTRTQTHTHTDQGFIVSDQDKASPSWDSVLGWTASIQTLQIITSQAVAGKLPTKKLHTSRIISVFTTAISSLWHLLHPQEAYRGSGCHNVPKFPSHWQQIHVVSGISLFLLILLIVSSLTQNY